MKLKISDGNQKRKQSNRLIWLVEADNIELILV